MAGTRALIRQNPVVAPSTTPDEEFVGPLTGWLNVVTGYSADPTGVSDSTTPFQNAFNATTQGKVLWIPAGTYKITATIEMHDRLNVSVIGADPATVTLQWEGADGDTMFFLEGVAYSRFNRMTINGNGASAGLLGYGVDQSWDFATDFFDTHNEYADVRFEEMSVGILGGTAAGFAEISIMRCQFSDCSAAAIVLNNFNALDVFIWHCRFEDCAIGVTNSIYAGAGNFDVFSSMFLRSTVADIKIGNTGYFCFRDNYSKDSEMFFHATFTANPNPIMLQGNTVLDNTRSDGLAVLVEDFGPLTLIDNDFRSPVGITTDPVVMIDCSGGGVILSVGNRFTTSDPLAAAGATPKSVDDTVVARAAITTTEPTLPGTPPNYSRTIFYAGVGTTGAQIQATIDAAVADSGTRNVVHLPADSSPHYISTGLVVPANSDIQIIGDGGGSYLYWNGANSSTVLTITGPTQVRLRDFKIHGDQDASVSSDGIVVTIADQSGARIFGQQIDLVSNAGYNLFVDALSNATIQLQDLYHVVPDYTVPSIKITGGTVNIFSAGTSNIDGTCYDVSGSANAWINGGWYEGIDPNSFLALAGSGSTTVSCQNIAVTAGGTPMTIAGGFSGYATFLNLLMDNQIVTAGDGTNAKVFAASLVGSVADFFDNDASPTATAYLINSRTRFGDPGSHPVSDEGSPSDAFIRLALAQIRAIEFTPPYALAAGITDLRIHRVGVTYCRYGIHIKAT